MIRSLTAALLVVLVGYGLIKAWPLLAGPSLTILSPGENGSYPNGIVPLRGTAVRAAVLTINGAPLLHDQNGDFSSTLTLPRGGSILTFVASDRFGRTITATRSIFIPATSTDQTNH